MNEIKIFAPATVANVSCGFDSLGLAVENLGDTLTFTKTKEVGVKITKITGAELPYDINTIISLLYLSKPKNIR